MKLDKYSLDAMKGVILITMFKISKELGNKVNDDPYYLALSDALCGVLRLERQTDDIVYECVETFRKWAATENGTKQIKKIEKALKIDAQFNIEDKGGYDA